MTRRIQAFCLLGLTIALAGSLTACAPLPMDFSGTRKGEMTSGERFGVTVGMSRQEARDVLTGYGMRVQSDDCRGDVCNGADTVDFYRMSGIGQEGHVTVFCRDGRVIRIRWYKVALGLS